MPARQRWHARVRLVISQPLASRSVAEVQRLAHAYASEIIGLLSHS